MLFEKKIISPIPSKYTKILEAQVRKLCESKIKKPISGFKAQELVFLF